MISRLRIILLAILFLSFYTLAAEPRFGFPKTEANTGEALVVGVYSSVGPITGLKFELVGALSPIPTPAPQAIAAAATHATALQASASASPSMSASASAGASASASSPQIDVAPLVTPSPTTTTNPAVGPSPSSGENETKNVSLCSGTGFKLEKAVAKGELYAIIMGIPNNASTGDAMLYISGKEGEEAFSASFSFKITQKDYPVSWIPLDDSSTKQRTVVDAKSVEANRVMNAAFAAFDKDAMYANGPYGFPLANKRITDAFGARRVYLYSTGGTGIGIHAGLDLGAAEGTRVNACAKGKVLVAQELSMYGNTVIIEHLPGVISMYNHLSRIDVKKGQVVTQGQRVGLVGMTGIATGPHLHWEMRVQWVAIDPQTTLSGALLDKAAIIATLGL